MKRLVWVGTSKKDLLKFPDEVRKEIGYALYIAQKGGTHESAKLFKGYGSGVYEIVSDYNKNTYRSVYIVNLNDIIYVLHAFQKKSKKGIKMPIEHIKMIDSRLKKLKEILNQEKTS